MSTNAPRTVDWIAKEIDLSNSGSVPFLMISGQVEASDESAEPYLIQICTNDFGANTLVLNLQGLARASDETASALRYVHFKKVERHRKYDNVLVLWQSEILHRMTIARVA